MERCETCRFWDNSSHLNGNEDTGRCVVNAPISHIMTGEAVWPFSESADWCGRHELSDEEIAKRQPPFREAS